MIIFYAEFLSGKISYSTIFFKFVVVNTRHKVIFKSANNLKKTFLSTQFTKFSQSPSPLFFGGLVAPKLKFTCTT